MKRFAAPGKAVLWGEYAVLDGAPAMVMAVDRYALCTVESRPADWSCSARGMQGEALLSREALLSQPVEAESSAGVVIAAIRALGVSALPAGAAVTTDTESFYADGAKLGIGSSAAICTATCAALASFLDAPFDFAAALQAHRLLQGSQGSGIDVAAAFHGGLLRFQDGTATPVTWPVGLHYQFVWTGSSARTTDHLGRFRVWKAAGDLQPLAALRAASEALFSNPGMPALHDYRLTLRRFDAAAGVGIYSSPHQRLDELAITSQVVYKPCGAGGGDIGVAFSRDPQALHHFRKLAERNSFKTLALEIADHGVQPTSQ